MALFDDAPTFVSDDSSYEYLSLWGPWFQHPTPRTAIQVPCEVPGPESSAAFLHPSAPASHEFRCTENEGEIKMDVASGQNMGCIVPLDTRMWSPSPVIFSPDMLLRSHTSDMRSYGSPSLSTGGPKDLVRFPLYRTPAQDGALHPATLHTQEGQSLNPSCSASMEYLHASALTNLDHPTFPQNTPQSLPSPPCSFDDHKDLGHGKVQPPITLYQTPRKKAPHHRHGRRRPCAINIEGLWIDKDDLNSCARQGNDIVSVHECQWAKSSNPCGLWIIGSRPRIGAHIRKWHPQSHADGMAECLWSGCTAGKAMLKDSINRHVVTVHLGEGFHCHGCNQELSRKDVYDQHARNGFCRDAEATIVYGREYKVIDTKKTLRRGAGVRFAD